MKISSPKSFRRLPPPIADFPRSGRPKSPLLLTLEALDVGRYIDVHLVRGQKPTLRTIRSSLPRWGNRLGKTFSIRKHAGEERVSIYRVK
jgi:hypothetical protein